MPDRSFRYRPEAKPPRTGPAGITRGGPVRGRVGTPPVAP